MMGRFGSCLLLGLFALQPLHAGDNGVVFAWSGAATPTGIRVVARIEQDSPAVRLLADEEADWIDARSSPHVAADLATNRRLVSIAMNNLSPGTRYHYAIEIDGQIDATKTGSFATPTAGPQTFTLAFAACAQTGSSHAVFDTIRAHEPQVFLHLGDLHYENIAVDDPDLFRSAFDTVLGSLTQSELYRSTSIAYVWDDHDYGPNDSDGTSPSRPAARQVYQEYVPHHPLVAGQGDVPIHQAFSIGRVRFLLTDSRSERDPNDAPDTVSKTMLGTAQRDWLEGQLLAANGVYPVIVWVNTVPWIDTTGDDSWARFTNERAEIADFIALNGIEGLVMLSGDAHMLAIDDGSNSDHSATGGAAIPVFHAGALDRPGSIKGGPYSEGTFPGGGQFGLMTVVDDGFGPICIEWSGRDANDTEIVGLSWCQPVAPPSDTDADGFDDVDDCSFADPGVWARPSAVDGLLLDVADGDVELDWNDQAGGAGAATGYDLVSGSIGELREDGSFARSGCAANDVPGSSWTDGSGDPAAGRGVYYLIRARNACGSGGYGDTSPSDPRFPLDGGEPCPI